MLATLATLIGGVSAALIGAWAALRARRPRKSLVELVDVSLTPPDPAKARRDDIPDLDIKLRNTGGQPAVVKRVVVRTHRAASFGSIPMPLPYDLGFPRFVGARLDVSETYDVTLPAPEKAAETRIVINVSQVVDPGEADRFMIRLGRDSIEDTVAYLLHLELLHDANGRTVTSPLLAVAFPQRVSVDSAEQIRRYIHDFQDEVKKVRQAIDLEMTARGYSAPDWITAAPKRRGDLPRNLLTVDGNGDPMSNPVSDHAYVVNENFWEPRRAIERYLQSVEQRYTELVDVIDPTVVAPEVLRAVLPHAQDTLAQVPALRAEFCTPGNEITVTAGGPATADRLDQLVTDRRIVEGLRARADAGVERAAEQLHTGSWLVEELEDRQRVLGHDHPETLDARENLVYWQVAVGDPVGAAAALAEILPDRVRVQGPDHERTLRARQLLAKCRGEAGDPAGAVADFAELVQDWQQFHGPDREGTLDARHELARWRGIAGNAAAAAAGFAELLPDRLRIQGPDHPNTLLTRHNLAKWRGEAGDPGGAVAAFAELLPDRQRVLGAHHPDTLATQRALANWQDQSD